MARPGAALGVSWNIVYEFLRIITHPRVLRRPWSAPQAWEFVAAVLAAPALEVLIPTARHAAIAAQTVGELAELRGNLLHDAHTAILMREHGVRRIVTRDTDFHRFPFLTPEDPLV